MVPATNLAELVGCAADERLVAEQMADLPVGVGRPAAVLLSGTRERVLGVGAALARAALIAGIALIVVGGVGGVWSGRLVGVAAAALGLALIATHAEWFAVAGAIAGAVEIRCDRGVTARREWLATVEPYAR